MSSSGPSRTGSTSLGSKDAIVVAEGDREMAQSAAAWQALFTFHRAPCLRESIGIGLAGGAGIGLLRHFSGSVARVAFTWGAVTGGLLSGTNWFVCRRAMYAKVSEEVALLARVQAGDADALREYQTKLEERARRNAERHEKA